jgi:hypothetical protein
MYHPSRRRTITVLYGALSFNWLASCTWFCSIKALTVNASVLYTYILSFLELPNGLALHKHHVTRREREKATSSCLDGVTRQFPTARGPELSSIVKLVCLHLYSVFVRSLIFLSIIATEYGRYQYDILQL